MYINRQSILTDIEVLRGPLDQKLFPGVSADATVHTGFRDQHAINADAILAEVKALIASKGAKSVTVVLS